MIKTLNAAKACIAILLPIALTACATTLGRNFDEVYAQQIKPGETTKAEVLQKLGRAPLRSRSGDEETWTYAYYRGRGTSAFIDWLGLSDAEEQGRGSQKRLTVIFKGDSVKESKFVVELPKPDR